MDGDRIALRRHPSDGDAVCGDGGDAERRVPADMRVVSSFVWVPSWRGVRGEMVTVLVKRVRGAAGTARLEMSCVGLRGGPFEASANPRLTAEKVGCCTPETPPTTQTASGEAAPGGGGGETPETGSIPPRIWVPVPHNFDQMRHLFELEGGEVVRVCVCLQCMLRGDLRGGVGRCPSRDIRSRSRSHSSCVSHWRGGQYQGPILGSRALSLGSKPADRLER